MREPKLYVASHNEITNGDATDIYFKRTQEALGAAGLGYKGFKTTSLC